MSFLDHHHYLIITKLCFCRHVENMQLHMIACIVLFLVLAIIIKRVIVKLETDELTNSDNTCEEQCRGGSNII
jgi:hypothetical protein